MALTLDLRSGLDLRIVSSSRAELHARCGAYLKKKTNPTEQKYIHMHIYVRETKASWIND